MKRLMSVFMAALIILGLIPITAFAQVEPKSQEFQTFLQEIGMSEDEFLTYLKDTHDFTLADFDSFSELKDYLGDPINEINLQELLDKYEITKPELENLLNENGTSLDEYVFYDDLYYKVSELLYKEELTPITEENLKELLSNYDFASKEELEKLLNENNDSIENYEYIEDLEMAVAKLVYSGAQDEIKKMLDEIGLTEAEMNKLSEYLMKKFSDENANLEEFSTKMEEIANRLMSFKDFDSADDLTAENVAEILDVWNDLLNLFELKTEFYLTKDGKTTPLSIDALIKIDSLNGADLLIKIFSKDGELLADMVLTAKMFDSDLLTETGKDLEKTEDVVKVVAKATDKLAEKAKTVKTVNGGSLPRTASDYLPNALGGLAIAVTGLLLYRRIKVNGI
ncbi:processed acidic surface protein [Neobacillus drentensis]|uniref:processed acidic surface protein n=1 Tax=Neobacillus drentensis TaxID=220684 RepID=UPI003000D858